MPWSGWGAVGDRVKTTECRLETFARDPALTKVYAQRLHTKPWLKREAGLLI